MKTLKAKKLTWVNIKEDENPNPRRSLAGLILLSQCIHWLQKKEDTGMEYGETGY
jgi:hypothetical protein